MKYLFLILVIITLPIFAQKDFPINKMACTGYVVNAPDELHEGYYYIGAVIVEKNKRIEIFNCLGGSISYVNEKIKNGKCGYSGIDKQELLKYRTIKNETFIYNHDKSLRLKLGYQNPNKIYELSGQYDFWGHLAPEIHYQVECRASLKQ